MTVPSLLDCRRKGVGTDDGPIQSHSASQEGMQNPASLTPGLRHQSQDSLLGRVAGKQDSFCSHSLASEGSPTLTGGGRERGRNGQRREGTSVPPSMWLPFPRCPSLPGLSHCQALACPQVSLVSLTFPSVPPTGLQFLIISLA